MHGRIARTGLLALLVALVTLSLAGGASAAPRIAGENQAAAKGALKIAAKFWKRPVCGGDVSFAWRPLGSDMEGRSSWSSFPGQPASQNIDCLVELNALRSWTWKRFCTIVVHEAGHLLGREHTARGVMAARYGGIVGPCRKARAPQGA